MNRPHPAATGVGSVVAITMPAAATTAPPRRVESTPSSIGDAVAEQPAEEHPAGRRDEPEPGLTLGDREAIGHHQRGPVVRRELGEGDRDPDHEEAHEDRARRPSFDGAESVRESSSAGCDRAGARSPAIDRHDEHHHGGGQQLRPQRDVRGRRPAGDDAAEHRAGRPHRVEAGDDRAVEALLQRDGLGVHRHVGQPVERAEADQHREQHRRRRRDSDEGEAHGQCGRRRDRDRATALAVDEPATDRARREPTDTSAEQRQPEGGVGHAERTPALREAAPTTTRTSLR